MATPVPTERADDGSPEPGTTRFLDIESCRSILDPFQACWRDLAQEASQLGADWVEHPDTYFAPFGWYLSPIRYFGIDNPEAMAAAPVLGDLVARDARVMTAQYLRLAPGAEVAAHRGRPMGVGRFHLGLVVPDDCGLQVGDVTRTWVEGEWIAFDDVQLHRTWNHSDRDRIVLSLDFEHPDIPMPRRAYATRFAQGAWYSAVGGSPRARRAMMWYSRSIRSRFWPLDDSS
ncbi:MAG: aspartyl/asparaginyl beta-hydroxylase domain-containing protein [Acidimicrobiales bacterium]